MKFLLIIFYCLFELLLFGQNKSIIVYDIFNGTLDTIASVNFDENILSENTSYSLGCSNQSIEILDTNAPITNLYPGTQFTYKQKVAPNYDLTLFPIRTTVKLFQVNNNTIGQLCSGSFISRKHILTATHCIANINTNDLRNFDSLFISPIFNNGQSSPLFKNSFVTKIYFFQDWEIGKDDFTVLELSEPVGETTGWISIGFNADNSLLSNGVFYKFSYPSVTNLWLDSNHYNGDTLFYNYGLLDNISNDIIGVNNTSGIQGESGSSIIKIKNNNFYTTYGVLSLSQNLSHSRLTNWKYYAILSIIKDDLYPNSKSDKEKTVIYPNPCQSILNIKLIKPTMVNKIRLYNSLGELCKEKNVTKTCIQIDVFNLPNGFYLLHLISNDNIISKKVIINN